MSRVSGALALPDTVPDKAKLHRVLRGANGALLTDLVDEFVGGLPLSSLAAPVLTAGLRRASLEKERNVSLRSVRAFLSGGSETGDLQQIFNTTKRRDALADSLLLFDSRVYAWARGALWDPRFKWIAPPSLRQPANVARRLRRTLESNAAGVALAGQAAVDVWLPLSSIEGLIEVQRLRSADVSTLAIAIERGCRSLKVTARARPWDRRFPARVAALPLHWLYQHEPTARMDTLIARLERGGCFNVGHLRILHPDAIVAARSHPMSYWISLRAALASLSRGQRAFSL
jgi:hypothetical protein